MKTKPRAIVFLLMLVGFIYSSRASSFETKKCFTSEEAGNKTNLKSIEIFNEHSMYSTAMVTLFSGQQAKANVIASAMGYVISIHPGECEKLPKQNSLGWPSDLCRSFSVVKKSIFKEEYGIVLYENGFRGRFDFIFNDFTCDIKE